MASKNISLCFYLLCQSLVCYRMSSQIITLCPRLLCNFSYSFTFVYLFFVIFVGNILSVSWAIICEDVFALTKLCVYGVGAYVIIRPLHSYKTQINMTFPNIEIPTEAWILEVHTFSCGSILYVNKLKLWPIYSAKG